MSTPEPSSLLGALPPAFAAACHQARSDAELFQRCRNVLAERFDTQAIWFTVTTPSGSRQLTEGPAGLETAVEVAHCRSGATELTIHAAADQAEALRRVAAPLSLGLSIVLDLHGVLRERQGALDDAVFQLRALRQVARLLSSAHSKEDTEHLVLDFMAEVFFAWWATLYRTDGTEYRPFRQRSLRESPTLAPIGRTAFDDTLPIGSAISELRDARLRALVPAETELVVPLDSGGERLALLLLGPRMNGQSYGRSERELAGTLAFAGAIALKNAELVERLHSAATTDDLTGLLNRRAMEERLEAEISRSARHQIRTTVVLFDIDRFKVINDTMGHAVGDRFLFLLGEVLQRCIRGLDVAGRLGGDEFLVILPMTTTHEARTLIRRLQDGVAALARDHPEYGQPTLSFGVAETPRHGTTVGDLLRAADTAMYSAKRAGRDSIHVADES